jgi:putative aminopeptidase FrvX
MKPSLFISLAGRLMRHPAAPFHEAAVRAEVESICQEHDLPFRRDRFGNVLVEYKRGRAGRPLVLVAHLDHPAFDVLTVKSPRLVHAKFLGGVAPEYFADGTRIRFLPDNSPGRLGGAQGAAGTKEFALIPDRPLTVPPAFAVWDLEDFALRGGLIHGRACDDLIGVAAILATLIVAKESRQTCWLMGAITRAEEIGFGGALALAASRSVRRNALVISLETSRELPPVRMGDGVIIRVGDRSSVFDPQATRFLTEVAVDRARQNPAFRHQRGLMPGGSCEGTVFAEAGFQTAALCVALGNYHNCGPRRRIAAEYVSLADAASMVELLKSAAVRMAEFGELTGRLRGRLAGLADESRGRLLRTAAGGLVV